MPEVCAPPLCSRQAGHKGLHTNMATVDDCGYDHPKECCPVHGVHSDPHVGCIALR